VRLRVRLEPLERFEGGPRLESTCIPVDHRRCGRLAGGLGRGDLEAGFAAGFAADFAAGLAVGGAAADEVGRLSYGRGAVPSSALPVPSSSTGSSLRERCDSRRVVDSDELWSAFEPVDERRCSRRRPSLGKAAHTADASRQTPSRLNREGTSSRHIVHSDTRPSALPSPPSWGRATDMCMVSPRKCIVT